MLKDLRSRKLTASEAVAIEHGNADPFAPLSDAQWTDERRQLVAKYLPGGRAGNGIRTLFNVPELVDGMMPFQDYITQESSISPQHREKLIGDAV